MINLALFGASGKMGRAVIEEANKDPSIHISNYSFNLVSNCDFNLFSNCNFNRRCGF